MSTDLDSVMTTRLQEQIDNLTSFNRHVAHDLRGPLSTLACAARMTQHMLARGEHDNAVHLLEMLAGRAENLMQLLIDLLALAEAADSPLDHARIDLTDLARSAIEQVSLVHDVPMHQFHLGRLPAACGTAGLLRQVFVNLLGNAAKFTRHVPDPRIEIGITSVDGQQALYVQDNGVGFDHQRAAGMFQPFSRLHGKEYAGHGIGLSLVKRVVERHGGRVWASSTLPHGATFYFTLGAWA